MKIPRDIDEYIAAYPPEVQLLLGQVRASIRKAAPKAEELISYGMPAFKLNRLLVWFAAHKSHIGFYPKNSAIEAFKKELAVYKWAKGSVQFPFNKKLPLALISKMVKFRVAEELQKLKKTAIK